MLKLPTQDAYQAAIQNPLYAFADQELKTTQVKTTPLGTPQVNSGGFALSYCVTNKLGESWCVRCFTKDSQDRSVRYAEISNFLAKNPRPFFVPVEYQSKGILVNNDQFPITKMPWIKGTALSRYIQDNLSNSTKLNTLAEDIRKLVAELESLGAAHGDLQHGNILILNNKPILVDYDGMYVPALAGQQAAERGHVNYQHPLRDRDFNPDLDRFSSIVLYLALKGMTSQLWNSYGTGENVLFSQDDFRKPDDSPLLTELEKNTELRPLVRQFRQICKVPLDKVPNLADFLSGRAQVTVSRPIQLPKKHNQYPIISADDKIKLAQNMGQMVTIIGQITEAVTKNTKYGQPYAFLSLGDWQQRSLRLTVWSEELRRFQASGQLVESFEGKWICITGLLGSWYQRPQIIVDYLSLIETFDEAEAKNRLEADIKTRPLASKISDPPHQPTPSASPETSQTKKLPEWVASQPSRVVAPPAAVVPAASKQQPDWLTHNQQQRVPPQVSEVKPSPPIEPPSAPAAPPVAKPTPQDDFAEDGLLTRVSNVFRRLFKL